jgi:ferritin-like metal-binding protein YciE
MNSETKIAQYLYEAHASELALVDILTSQIAMTPRGTYRSGLETHLEETRDHAERVQARLRELGASRNPLLAATGLALTAFEQALALAKTPLDMVRGTSGSEKVLKNAKDAAATEALEIATYQAIERLARTVGDTKTATLAASIRADEEKMLKRITDAIPGLTDDVVREDVEGEHVFEVTKTGAADAARTVAKGAKTQTKRTARTAARKTERTARTAASKTQKTARKVPGEARAEGTARGAVASAGDLPIARYDSLNADEVVAKLSELGQADLAKVDTYERRHENRTTVTDRISTLQGDQPWSGYDEQNVADIRKALTAAGDERVREVRSYERSHKNRAGVLEAAEQQKS